ncbi:MAG: hypothetical protein ACQEQ4_05230 [Fibrobacterota bacterium]
MKVKFEAGSLESHTQYLKTILRYRLRNNSWEKHKILIHPAKKYVSRQEAAMHCKYELDMARHKAMMNKGSYTIDHYLSEIGYQELAED